MARTDTALSTATICFEAKLWLTAEQAVPVIGSTFLSQEE